VCRRLTISAVAISAALLGGSPIWAQGSGQTILSTPGPVPVVTSGAPPYMEAWLGFGLTQSYYGTWVGGVVALNPQRNVWESGFVLRGEATIGRYDVENNPFQDSVLMHGASWMFGYRQRIGEGTLTGYIGANYENHDNDSKFDRVRGLEVGFRALVEYYTRITPSWDIYAQASHSTAFDTTFLFARSGFQLSSTIWAGPETAYFRNVSDYSENRLGAFVRFENGFFGNGITLSGGWVNALRGEDDDGWYAALNIDFQFR
jgi:Cellulose biosynthesis protein BcsS